MNLGLTGKRALVLAGTSGLGRGTATALAGEGARVAICGRSLERARVVAGEIAEATGNESVTGFQCDVADGADLERLFAAVAAELGGIDVLVGNAGGPPAGGFDTLTDAAWAQAFELTLMSVVRSVRLALPHMRSAGGGSIVVIGSSSVRAPIKNLTLSNAYRPAVQALCKDLATNLAGEGIRVNVVSPGRIDTPRIRELDGKASEREGISLEAARARSVAAIPLGRIGTVEEFGRVAAFLASDASSYVTGVSLLVDGGLVTSL
ncbi:MAG: SDR family oxidoreductase [Trueperaceae bacterium]|nr:SDR family oxidoreductase [Trueperaceae bacterium]MCO5173618.1 SDR family oxidoreductase [Trueperaceae bacterium]MCW5819799.1 SDR family oxidoreductase [Trueperaceae bacterium]